MTENTTASGQPHRWAKAIKDAYEEGCWAISTYNDEPTETVDEAWERSDAKCAHDAALAASAPVAPIPPESLHTFLNAAAAEGYVLNGVDAADLYVELFPERYVAALEGFHSGMHEATPEVAPVAPAPQPAVLTADQKEYLDQAQTMLEDYAEILDRAGSNSAAKGAEASAHVIRGMLEAAPQAPLQPITEAEQAAWHALDEGRSQARVPLQQGEYLPLPECDATTIGLGAVWNRHGVRAAIDADRASRGAAQAAPAVTAQGQYYDALFASSGHRPYFLPFSARTAIAARHGTNVTKEFNALVADVVSEFIARHLTTPAVPAPVTDGAVKALHDAMADCRKNGITIDASVMGFFCNRLNEQPAPVAEDAANWHWLASYLVGPRTDLDDEIVASKSVNDLRKLVSAARARAQAAQPEGGA